MSVSRQLKCSILALLVAVTAAGCVSTNSPLVQAGLDGDLKRAKVLVEQGAAIDVQACATGFDYVCCTALTCAANAGHLGVVQYLIQQGADVNTVDNSSGYPGNTNWTPLHYAAMRGHLEMTYYLLGQGADPGLTTSHGSTPADLAKTPEIQALLAGALQKRYASQYAAANRGGSPSPASGPQPGAASRGAKGGQSDVDRAIPAGRPAGKYDVAVVIGNADYSATGTPDVDYALQDARSMRQYLVKAFGYDPANIIYLENASLAKMSEVFGTASDPRGKLHKWVKPGLSRIFVYYVGHGAPDQQSGDGYFVPVDANPQYINASGYKLSTFYDNLAQIPALKKTVVIDACFSGSSANGQLLKGVSGITARLKSEPKAGQAADLLLTSAGMNQVSSWYPEQGHSLFTYYFLKGVQGAADGNGDGRITMGEMKGYLDDQVPYMARRLTGNDQQPVLLGKDEDVLFELVR